MTRTKRFIASLLGVALLGTILATPALAAKPAPPQATLSQNAQGDLILSATGLKAGGATTVTLTLDGTTISGYPVTIKMDTYADSIGSPDPGVYVATFTVARSGAFKTSATYTVPVPDLCPNIAGVQATVPEGYGLDINGNCVDTTPPVVTVPANFTVEATGPDGAVVDYEATAFDAVDGGVLLVTCAPVSRSQFPIGDTVVGCDATDAAGNYTRESFTVTVTNDGVTVVGSGGTCSLFIILGRVGASASGIGAGTPSTVTVATPSGTYLFDAWMSDTFGPFYINGPGTFTITVADEATGDAQCSATYTFF